MRKPMTRSEAQYILETHLDTFLENKGWVEATDADIKQLTRQMSYYLEADIHNADIEETLGALHEHNAVLDRDHADLTRNNYQTLRDLTEDLYLKARNDILDTAGYPRPKRQAGYGLLIDHPAAVAA